MKNSNELLQAINELKVDVKQAEMLEDVLKVAMKSQGIKLVPPAEAEELVLFLGRFPEDTEPITNYGTDKKPVYYIYYHTFEGIKYTFPAYFMLNDCYVGTKSFAVHVSKLADEKGFPEVLAISNAVEVVGDDRKVYALSQYEDYYQGVYSIENEKEKQAEMKSIRDSGLLDDAVKNLAKVNLVLGRADVSAHINAIKK